VLNGDDKYVPDDDNYEPSGVDSGEFEEQVNTVDVNNIDEEIEIQDDTNELSSTPSKNILLLLVALVGSLYLVYNLVFSEDDPEKEKKEEEKRIAISQPVTGLEKPTESMGSESTIDVGEVIPPDIPDFETEGTVAVDQGFDTALPDAPDTETSEFDWPVFSPDGEEVGSVFRPEDFPEVTPQLPSNVTTPPNIQPNPVPIPNVQTENVLAGPGAGAPAVNQGPTAEEIAAMKMARKRQGMLLVSGGGSPTRESEAENDILTGDFEMEETDADKQEATLIGNTDTMIAQGKMIDAVLETAINSNLQGLLRAVVSRDVYAESGRNVLIPKGSRLIGNYAASSGSTGRVVVSWQRVIRPDGIDVMIESPGTDKMGRAGIAGFVDNKYLDVIINSILLSTLSIGSAILVDDVTEAQQQTTTTTTGGSGTTTSNTGTTTDAAVLSSVNDMSDIADEIAEGLLDRQATVIVQQGAKIKVFVNRDLHFPRSVASSITFIK
jgi:type IV secretion system protein VirB10